MSINSRPEITPALTIRPMSKALEFAIASAIKEREDAAVFVPVSQPGAAGDTASGTALDKRS